MSRKPVSQFVNEFFRHFQDVDFTLFEIYDTTKKEKKIKCLASNQTKCDEKFPSELTHDNVTCLFKHLHDRHAIIYECVTNGFLRWYDDLQKVRD